MRGNIAKLARNAKAYGWVVLATAAFAVSVATYWHLIGSNPGNWTHTDEWVYRAAGGLTRRDPARLYDVRLGAPGQQQLPFTYPPFAASIFAILSPLSFATWQVGLVVINVALLPVIAYLCLRHGSMSERRR